jgi:hypothetical protein
MFPIVDVCSSAGDVRSMGRLSYRAKLVLRVFALKFAFALVFSGFTYSPDAHAYAWMIRHSYTACGSCHADPSGGELLTHYGRVTSDLVLRTQYGGGEPKEKEGAKSSEGPPTGMFWGALDLPKALLMSGSYRNLYLIRPGGDKVFTFVPVMQADLYAQVRAGPITAGGSLGIAKVPDGSPHARPAQITSGPGDSINLISRTHYLGADLGDKFVLRAGRLNLPFGVRMPEHTLWAREATRTDRESDQQHGLALAYVGENLRMEVMGIAGNFQTRLQPGGVFSDLSPGSVHERGYSMFVEGISGTNFAAGVSSKVTYAELDRVTFERKSLRQAHGLTMRWAAHETLTFMSEANALFRSNANPGYVGFTQADWEPVQGLHFLLTGELLDQGMPVQAEGEPSPIAQPGVGAPRTGGWVSLDWFFFRQMEFRTDLLLRQNEPLTIMGQFHMYL